MSAFGDGLYPVALAFAVVELTGSAADLGLVFMAVLIPRVVLVLGGGVWADRLPRQRVMLGADVLRCAMQALTAVFLFSGHDQLWPLLVLSALYGAGDAFFQPAITGLVPETVQPSRIQQANALLGLTRNSFFLAGPVVAGIVVASAGPAWAFAVDAASFAVSAAFLSLMRLPRELRAQRKPFVAELRAGWRKGEEQDVGVDEHRLLRDLEPRALADVRARAVRGRGVARRCLELGSDRHLRRGRVAGRSGRRASPEAAAALATASSFSGSARSSRRCSPDELDRGRRGRGGARVRRLRLRRRARLTSLQERIPAGSISRVSAYDWLGSIVFKPAGYALVGPLVAAIGTRSTLLLCAAVIGAASVVVSSLASVRAVTRPGEIPETADRLSLT